MYSPVVLFFVVVVVVVVVVCLFVCLFVCLLAFVLLLLLVGWLFLLFVVLLFSWPGTEEGDRQTAPLQLCSFLFSRRRPPHPLRAAPPSPYATPIAVSYSPPPTPFSLHLSLLSPEFRVTPTSAELVQTNAGKRTQTSTMYFCPDKQRFFWGGGGGGGEMGWDGRSRSVESL